MALRRGSLFSGRRSSEVGPPIAIDVGSVTLKGKTAVAASKVVIELDMPGKEDEMIKSEAAAVKTGVANVNLKARFEVFKSGDPVREALIAALQTEEEEDSEVLIYLHGVSGTGAQNTLGVASFRLERILATKKDVKAQLVPFLDNAGSTVAEAKMTVTALAALSALQAEARQQQSYKLEAAATTSGDVIGASITQLSLRQLRADKIPPFAVVRCELLGSAGLTKPIARCAPPPARPSRARVRCARPSSARALRSALVRACAALGPRLTPQPAALGAALPWLSTTATPPLILRPTSPCLWARSCARS